jgi:hypothetical protein
MKINQEGMKLLLNANLKEMRSCRGAMEAC